MKHIILIAGMPHSGSTLLYNIILNLFKHAQPESIIAGALNEIDAISLLTITKQLSGKLPPEFEDMEGESFPIALIAKTHRLNLNGEVLLQHENTKVFTTKRDIRDCSASNVRRMKIAHEEGRQIYMKAYIKDSLNAYDDWKERSDFEFNYEVYKNGDNNKKISIILNIVQILDLTLERSVAKEILHFVEEILPSAVTAGSTSEIITESLLLKNHMTNKGMIGGYKDLFDSNEIEAIEEVAGDWLKEHGYME